MSRRTHTLQVSVDTGCYHHHAAVGLSNGEYLGSFEFPHNKAGFLDFFTEIERYKKYSDNHVCVAMEGYNGHARPLDQMVQSHDYRLFNINNVKLSRFKEIFPGAAKTDRIDARKGLELFQLQQSLPLARNVLQEVTPVAEVEQQLKRLSRRRRRLVDERTRYINALQADLRSLSPGLIDIAKDVGNVWFLNFLASATDLRQLARRKKASLLKVKQVGKRYANVILAWQETALFSNDIAFVWPLVRQDVLRIIELRTMIKTIDKQLVVLMEQSAIAQHLLSIKGFGDTSCAELAGEIGCVERFEKETSLALYLGMAVLDNSSGTYQGSKRSKQVNQRAKRAMMNAVDKHRKWVEQSGDYYQKKRDEGKKHNQALRSLGRHLVRVIFKMLKENRDYYL
ncbi:MAG: IS110 family transposase [Gammaproteobacteria bacterium]|nr:IS110 family transposase [Gammaproteobacteria bacterium]MCF6229900.1 IS110 family transposase [Gammaproteobacteria bacterium]